MVLTMRLKPDFRAIFALLMLCTSLQAKGEERPVLVFAAASLRGSLEPVATRWRADTGHAVTISYGASSALIKQIEAGAPADIFISADRDWMDYGAARSLIDPKTRVDLLGNRLALIAPKTSILSLVMAPGVDLARAAGEGRIAVGDVRSVPVGKYAKAALEHLGAWPGARSKLALTENARAALALVARGEATLGIVYVTDARAEPNVKIVALFPEQSHPPIVYPFALVRSSRSPAARDFLSYLSSAAALTAFQDAGFVILR